MTLREFNKIRENRGNIIASNNKVMYCYNIKDIFQTGIELHGNEVKSIRLGNCSIKESYIKIINGELKIIGMTISKFDKASGDNEIAEDRIRRLLVHKSELNKIKDFVETRGCSIVALEVVLVNNKIKLNIALATGKKLYDKRESIKERDIQRDIERKEVIL